MREDLSLHARHGWCLALLALSGCNPRLVVPYRAQGSPLLFQANGPALSTPVVREAYMRGKRE